MGRTFSAGEYRDSLPPDRQEHWDAIMGKPYVPQGPGIDTTGYDKSEGRGLRIGVIAVPIGIVVWKCWDVVSGMGPDEGWLGVVVWVLFTLSIVWGLISIVDD